MRSKNDLVAVLRSRDKYEQAEEEHRQARGRAFTHCSRDGGPKKTPKFRGVPPESLEEAALETISVKLLDLIYLTSVADTFDPHLCREEDTELVNRVPEWWPPIMPPSGINAENSRRIS
jgi:hypothetical protein